MKNKTSPSVSTNKEPILEIFKKIINKGPTVLLEIGSGTGEHAIHIAKALPDLYWYCSDLEESHQNIEYWLNHADLPNISKKIATYKASRDKFPDLKPDYVFTANSLHIMSLKEVRAFIADLSALNSGSVVIIYGPFNYSGQYSSESNKEFDKWLKNRNELWGIKDFSFVKDLMKDSGFVFKEDIEMPANNRILLFKKI